MCPPLLQGVPQLALCLSEEPEHHMKAAAVWSIGQIGHHTPEHAKAVATASLLPKLLELYMDASSSEDLQAKVRSGGVKLSRFRLIGLYSSTDLRYIHIYVLYIKAGF